MAFPCSQPCCDEYVDKRGDFCPAHARPLDGRIRDRKDAKGFYNSSAWRRARATKLAHTPWCEKCLTRAANIVHHRIPLRDCSPIERLTQSNLQSICHPCHNEEDGRKQTSD